MESQDEICRKFGPAWTRVHLFMASDNLQETLVQHGSVDLSRLANLATGMAEGSIWSKPCSIRPGVVRFGHMEEPQVVPYGHQMAKEHKYWPL